MRTSSIDSKSRRTASSLRWLVSPALITWMSNDHQQRTQEHRLTGPSSAHASSQDGANDHTTPTSDPNSPHECSGFQWTPCTFCIGIARSSRDKMIRPHSKSFLRAHTPYLRQFHLVSGHVLLCGCFVVFVRGCRPESKQGISASTQSSHSSITCDTHVEFA